MQKSSADPESGGSSDHGKKQLARQMLLDIKHISKLIEECAEINEELSKSEHGDNLDKSTGLKFKN